MILHNHRTVLSLHDRYSQSGSILGSWYSNRHNLFYSLPKSKHIVIKKTSELQWYSQLDNGRGVHNHTFVFCIIIFICNQLFDLWFVNIKVCEHKDMNMTPYY